MHNADDRTGRATLIGLTALIGLGLAACSTAPSQNRAAVDFRGTQPSQTPQPSSNGLGDSGVSGPGIVRYDGYQAARAQRGDTVSSLAARIGLSATELGAYNGLSPTQSLRAGDELVLPPRPDGYGRAAAAPAPQAPSSSIEAQPLDLSAAGSAGTPPPLPDGALSSDEVLAGLDPAQGGSGSAWSPALAATAIDRATGVDPDGRLLAPPSTTDPLPANPPVARPLTSPDLGQYQSPTNGDATQPPAEPTTPAAAPQDAQVASVGARGAGRLSRPVSGPIALGFREGAGGMRNDGVDFAAPAGSPVVAADDGEVALISEALGGLGTIVLIRHPGELLTVYGRITGVSLAKGDFVTRGQQIGVVAPARAPAEPRMHFEVRQGATSVDPLDYIPG